jgi:predicted  nucleic acid-binding Zn-ribbon protein
MKTILAVLLIANIAFSNAVFLKKPSKTTFSVLNQLQDFENHDFGKKILDTIALQMKNQAPLADVAKMLAEIRQDLVLKEQEMDQLHAEQENECETDITEYIRRIDVASQQRDDATTEIGLLQGEISNLETEIANKGEQLDILAEREAQVRSDRERDHYEFEDRQKRTVEVIGAVDLIVEKLSSIKPEKSPEAALAELAKIGSSNPILALAQVASTFSKASLDNVIGKMEELRTSLEEAMEQDRKDEEKAQSDFVSLLGEIETTRKTVAAAKAEAEGQLMQKQGALAL